MTAAQHAKSSALLFAIFFTLAPVEPAGAQGTARSMDIDVSLRSAAMGGASNALCRGPELNHWANPALLAYVKGVRYERARTQLVPGLADDVWFTTNFTKVGGGGLGFAFGGEPAGPAGVFLDYGTNEGTDEQGNPTGTFASWEWVRSWGFGVNVLETWENVLEAAGEPDPGVSRYFDVSIGASFKEVEVALAPGFPGGVGRTRAHDLGLLARATPVDRLEDGHGLPIRIDLSYGYSTLSANDDARITFISEDMASRVSRHRRHGTALAVGLGVPGLEVARLDPIPRAFVRGLLPLVSVSVTSDWATIDAGSGVAEYETTGRGFEVALANVFAYRRGRYIDREGDIDGRARGFSVGVPVGSFGGWLYEEAWIPQARGSDLEDVHRTGYAVWVDPVAIWRACQPGKPRRSI